MAYFTVADKLVIEIYLKSILYDDVNEICNIVSAEIDKNMECYEPVHAGSEIK